MIYLDHSATTPVDERVVQSMLPFWTGDYGNPSSLYRLGRRAATALEDARTRLAGILGCRPAEIVITSCGSESDNLALRGVGLAQAAKGRRHIITTPVEHPAVLETAAQLETQYDFEITIVPVDECGRVDAAEIASAIRPDTALISVMYANNEVGTVMPIAEIGALAKAHGIPFHTDAVQAGGYLALNVDALGVDLLSLSAHKFHGPKGIGLLYVRGGTPIQSVQTGGGQERGRRAGTENVPYIVGMAHALELAQADREAEVVRLQALRDRMAKELIAQIPDVVISGPPIDAADERLPGHLSLVIRGVEAEGVLIALDMAGIAASSGSACATGAPTPSAVLTAMGFDHVEAMGALRLTLGRGNTDIDLDAVIEQLPAIIRRMRG